MSGVRITALQRLWLRQLNPNNSDYLAALTQATGQSPPPAHQDAGQEVLKKHWDFQIHRGMGWVRRAKQRSRRRTRV